MQSAWNNFDRRENSKKEDEQEKIQNWTLIPLQAQEWLFSLQYQECTEIRMRCDWKRFKIGTPIHDLLQFPWAIDQLIDRLIDWLIDWLIDYIDWLIDCGNVFGYSCQKFSLIIFLIFRIFCNRFIASIKLNLWQKVITFCCRFILWWTR